MRKKNFQTNALFIIFDTFILEHVSEIIAVVVKNSVFLALEC